MDTNQIKRVARITAQTFVDEFNEALDPAKTDWDAAAWEADRAEALGTDATSEDAKAGFLVYQAELVAATQYLADGHELLVTTAGDANNLT